VAQNDWQGLAVMGAPVQVENPGLIERIRAEVGIPVTSALESGAAALKAFGVRKALLLTPFDQRRNELLRDHLAGLGIEALLPKQAAEKEGASISPQSADRYTPEDVHAMAVNNFKDAQGAEAIYFQGAPLDPLTVWERLEQELGVPVVLSNPAMLWHILSLLGLRYNIPGGRLLCEWPYPVAA
jgi:maleate cis-trans isomerase